MVRSASESSFSKRSLAMIVALSIGTLVNNDITSNEIRFTPTGRLCCCMKVENQMSLTREELPH